jgi:hypothetical protein
VALPARTVLMVRKAQPVLMVPRDRKGLLALLARLGPKVLKVRKVLPERQVLKALLARTAWTALRDRKACLVPQVPQARPVPLVLTA